MGWGMCERDTMEVWEGAKELWQGLEKKYTREMWYSWAGCAGMHRWPVCSKHRKVSGGYTDGDLFE